MTSKYSATVLRNKAAQTAPAQRAKAVTVVKTATNKAVQAGTMTTAQAAAAVAQIKAAPLAITGADAPAAAAAAVAAAKHAALCACSSAPPLDLPPCWVDYTTAPAAGDGSPEAQLYGQLGKVADYLAAHVARLASDTTDRNGQAHVNPANLNAATSQTVAAISRAISLYVLNFPYSAMQAAGWKQMLSNILAMPLVTWNTKQGFYSSPTAAGIPTPLQQRATDKWSIHPSYFAFFFWRGGLSFLRFLRYDPTLGFVFTDTFAQLVNSAILANYFGPLNAIPIESYGPLAQSADPDGFRAQDPDDDWLSDPDSMPAKFVAQLQAVGNASYSASAHAELMQFVGDLAIVVALATVGSAFIATGAISIANGISLVEAMDPQIASGNGVLGDILCAGKVLDLDSFVENASLDMTADPAVQAATVPAGALAPVPVVSVSDLNLPGASSVSVDSSDFDTSGLDISDVDTSDLSLASIGDPTIDTTGLNGDVDTSGSIVDQTQLTSSIFINPPDVPISDAAGTDLSTSVSAQAVNVAPQDPSTATPQDYSTTGTDTSAMDNAQAQALTASTATGAFNLANYVGILARIYSAVTGAIKTGSAAPGTANRPAPGTRTLLPNGDTAVTNGDGSTTIYGTNGQALETVLPSGKVISGGTLGSSNNLLVWAIGAAALLGLMMTF